MNLFIKFFVLNWLIFCVQSLKILIYYPLPSVSLNYLGETQARLLINAGHEVTFITNYPLKDKPERNYREIYTPTVVEAFSANAATVLNVKYILENGILNEDPLYFQQFGLGMAQLSLLNENVTNLLKDPKEDFDVVITDFYETELYAGLSAVFNCPMIWYYGISPNWSVMRLIDDYWNPAYTVSYLSVNVPPLDFYQRTYELWTLIKWIFYKRFVTLPLEQSFYQEYFGPFAKLRGRSLPPYQELMYNASIVFCNDYNVGGNLPALPQNFKMVGGLHFKSHNEPLPKDLQTIMDKSKHGVIFFSFGSAWQSKDIPEPMKTDLLKMFGELKQTVIWKYEDDDLKNVPANVHPRAWLPQPSLLAHKNFLIFITHGGQMSSTEAVKIGVPLIGVPIMFDQLINIKKAVSLGYALEVNLDYDLVKNLKSAINVMAEDPKYRQRAKELSLIYEDRPVAPGAELVHWVEHAMRTRGAAHLRTPALTTPLYQKIYLDLAAVIFVAIVIFVMVAKRLTSYFVYSKRKNQKKIQ